MSKATSYEDFVHVEGKNYKLGSDLVWEIGGVGSGKFLTIPAGTPFNSSVPLPFWWVVSPHHKAWLLAAAVHDYLLSLDWSDKAFAAGEWYRAARAKSKTDSKSWLVIPAYYGVVIWTVR